MNTRDVLEKIIELPDDFHEAGVMQADVLEEIFSLCSRQPIHHSAETGCGKTALLFSWLSQQHTVFTLEAYGKLPCLSYVNVKQSELLNADRVQFVLGPTQQTLPRHEFSHTFDFVLIDGPHGFPYPQLEYYYFYPQLAENGILAIDDTHIPSVQMLSDFVERDDMFEPLSQVSNTRFFRRTEAPTFNPFGDDWWLQGYNQQP